MSGRGGGGIWPWLGGGGWIGGVLGGVEIEVVEGCRWGFSWYVRCIGWLQEVSRSPSRD